MKRISRSHRLLFGVTLGTGATLALVVSLGVFAGVGAAARAVAPTNTSPPTITGTPQEGQKLTGAHGTWTGSPTDFNDNWQRCDKSGGSCSDISGSDSKTYTLTSADVGNTVRFRSGAQNADGRTYATSAPSAVITAAAAVPVATPASATGCPAAGSAAIQIAGLSSPARLLVDGQQASPTVVHRGTQQLIVRYHVSACGGRSVQGALIYATAVPFNQFSIPSEATTGASGWAEVNFNALQGFPVTQKQGLIAIFVRARSAGGDILGGVSSRRLFSVPVSLR